MFDWLADRKASKGAAQMDQKSPNWPSEINKKKLDIRHCNECIIAQSQKTLYLRGFSALFGMEGWSRQGRRFAKQHGFFVSRFAQLFGFHRTLRSAWVRQIDKRLAAQPVAD